jgi:NAD(P)H-hydrate repair Nnr-like enzyme with NAD(P)H-hydrate dehydratase domain
LLASNRAQIDSSDLNLAQIALAAAQLHSLAADRAAKAGPMVASDLPDALRSIVGEYFA